MLAGGRSKEDIKLTIGHISANIAHYRHIKDFGKFKSYYEKLYEDAVHGRVSAENAKPKISEEAWPKAHELVTRERKKFEKWYYKQLAGVTDVELEDYISQAMLFAYEQISMGVAPEHYITSVKYKLDDYMYRRRNNDKSIKRGDIKDPHNEINNIIRYSEEDISDIIDRIKIETPESPEENPRLAAVCKNLLSVLDSRTAGIIADYHGLNGISYTFKEIAIKYGLSSDGYANRLYHAGLAKLRSLPPPDLE